MTKYNLARLGGRVDLMKVLRANRNGEVPLSADPTTQTAKSPTQRGQRYA